MRILTVLLLTILLLAAPALAQVPRLNVPGGLAITPARFECGRKLFHDPRLSVDGTVACATCHRADQGFADHNGRAVGILGRQGTRKTPTIVNSSYSPLQFHDGRTLGQQTQSLQPIRNRLEMGAQTEGQVLNRIRGIPGYVQLFDIAYGRQPGRETSITRETYGHAIASYEQGIVCAAGPATRRLAGDLSALSPAAEIGFGIFMRAGCTSCHRPPLFTDFSFRNNGSEFAGKPAPDDDGRFVVVRQAAGTSAAQPFLRAYKVPSLWAVADRAPYMHHGQFDSLHRVLLHYNAGGAKLDTDGQLKRDASIDPRIRPLGLTAAQIDCLEIFMREGFRPDQYPAIGPPVLP